MTILQQLPQETKDAYNSIRAGNSLVNPNAAFILQLTNRFNDIKSAAQSTSPSDPSITELITNINNLLPEFAEFVNHTNFIVSDNQPSGANVYNFSSRIGILQAILNIVETDFDESDPDTVEDKKRKYFGSVQNFPIFALQSLDESATVLEQAIANNTLADAAPTQNAIIITNTNSIDTIVAVERAQPDQDIARLKDFGMANILYNMTNNDDQAQMFSDLLNNILSPELKTDYNWNS